MVITIIIQLTSDNIKYLSNKNFEPKTLALYKIIKLNPINQ